MLYDMYKDNHEPIGKQYIIHLFNFHLDSLTFSLGNAKL